jgi:hypothetical protein
MFISHSAVYVACRPSLPCFSFMDSAVWPVPTSKYLWDTWTRSKTPCDCWWLNWSPLAADKENGGSINGRGVEIVLSPHPERPWDPPVSYTWTSGALSLRIKVDRASSWSLCICWDLGVNGYLTKRPNAHLWFNFVGHVTYRPYFRQISLPGASIVPFRNPVFF